MPTAACRQTLATVTFHRSRASNEMASSNTSTMTGEVTSLRNAQHWRHSKNYLHQEETNKIMLQTLFFKSGLVPLILHCLHAKVKDRIREPTDYAKGKGARTCDVRFQKIQAQCHALIDWAMDDINLHKKRSRNSDTELHLAIAPQQVMRENLVIGVKIQLFYRAFSFQNR